MAKEMPRLAKRRIRRQRHA